LGRRTTSTLNHAGTTSLVGPETFTLRALLERLLAMLGRQQLLLPLPFALAEALAAGFERRVRQPLTREEVRLLRTDKVAGGLPIPATLGIAARRLDQGLPASLHAGR
jgi:NADH dehydrogenase